MCIDWLAVISLFRDNSRTITSLPVSPCSSPLRQYGPAHKSCFLSPPHPTYTMMGQNHYTVNEFPSYPLRSNATFTLDPWYETSLYKAHTPGGSPRSRPIWAVSVNTNRTIIFLCLPWIPCWAQTSYLEESGRLYMRTRRREKEGRAPKSFHFLGTRGRPCCL